MNNAAKSPHNVRRTYVRVHTVPYQANQLRRVSPDVRASWATGRRRAWMHRGEPYIGTVPWRRPTGARDVNRQLREMADELGIGQTLRRVRQTVLPTARRNRRDNEHLNLLLSFLLSEDSNCIDIGAHSGEILRSIVRLAPGGQHLAFEPLPHLYKQLVSEFPNVDVRSCALSDSPGTLPFTHVVSRPAYSGLVQRVAGDVEEVEEIIVNVECLDDIVPDGYHPAFIKIDVEGAEYQALRGGSKLIAKSRPHIAFEFGAGSAPHYGTTPDDMYKLIDDEFGLSIYDMDGTGPFTLAAFRETYYSGSRFNFVAHA